MPRIVLIPLIVLAIAVIALLALGIPSGAPTQTPYEKTITGAAS